jgi:hypothetical protein
MVATPFRQDRRMVPIACRRILPIVAVVLAANVALGQNGTWTGTSTTDGNWSTTANWLNNTPPTAGGIVTFDFNSTGTVTTANDLLTSVGGVVVAAVPGGAGANPVAISGPSFSLGAGGINMNSGTPSTPSTQNLTFNLGGNDLTLSASQTWTAVNARSLTINGNHLFLSGSTAAQTLTVNVPTTSGNTVFNAVIADSSAAGASPSNLDIESGTSGTATGFVEFLQANTYTGSTTLHGRGTIYQIGSDSAFGTGPVTIMINGVVCQFQSINGNHSVPNPFIVNGGFQFGGSGNLTFNGAFTIGTSRTITYNSSAGTVFTFNGPITIGTSGAAAGTFTTSVVAGTPTATGALVFNGVISEAAGVTTGASIALTNGNGTAVSSDQFNNQNTFTGGINATGQGATIIAGTSSTLSGTTIVSGPFGTGTVTAANALTPVRLMAANGAQTVANNFTLTNSLQVQGTNDITLSGVLTGAGGLVKTGTNTLNLTGANTYTSTSPGTSLIGGRLLANNPSGTSATGTSTVSVTGTGAVGSGGTLGGNGFISGQVTISSSVSTTRGGTVAPGNSIGTLNVGNMIWNPVGQYAFEHSTLSSANPGITNDLINGSGTLDLSALTSGATFTLNLIPLDLAVTPQSQTYTIATFASGIIGSGGPFANGTDVSNLLTLAGSFTTAPASFAAVVGNSGGPQSLVITFTPVPEPAFVLAACGLAAVALRRRRTSRTLAS